MPGPDGALRVRVTAPADAGKANAAVIALLAKACAVSPRAVSIATGAAARRKRIHVAGEPQALMELLARAGER
jgi:hypothetical protein